MPNLIGLTYFPDPEARSRAGPSKREINLSGGRKKILAMREKRRQEDLAAAMAMKNEMKGQQSKPN